jgi:DNA-binding NtrC family response regulator
MLVDDDEALRHGLGALLADRPFVKLNCATWPCEVLESELFGHEKGAFAAAVRQKPGNLEFANQGTIFLDEAGGLEHTRWNPKETAGILGISDKALLYKIKENGLSRMP